MATPYGAVCDLFQEFGYQAYIQRHGCDFGRFTCCNGVNTTILDTFARETCNTTAEDVCGYDNNGDDILLFVFIIVLVSVTCYLFAPKNDERVGPDGGPAYSPV